MGDAKNSASAVAEQSAALRERRRREAVDALLDIIADRSAREIEALCQDLEQRYADADRAEALRELTAAAAVTIRMPATRDRYRSTIAQPAAVIAWMLTLEKRLITAAATAARMAA